MIEYASNYTEIVALEGSYALALDQQKSELLYTPKGSIVNNADESFIKHISSELEQFPYLKTENGALIDEQLGYVTSYSLHSGLVDFVQESEPPNLEEVMKTLTDDPLLHASAGPEQTDQYRTWGPIAKYLETIGITEGLNIFVSAISIGSTEFHAHDEDDEDNSFISFSDFSTVIHSEWTSLSGPQRVVVNVLVTLFDSLLATLCFVKGACTSSEFAHAVLAGSTAFHVFGDPDGDIHPDQIHRDSYKEAVEIASTCTAFLGFADSSRIYIEKLIGAGEGKSVEFKSTLRWNIKAQKNDDAITHASIKTIAAFLNTNGGKLFIGVDDDGKALGLSLDGFQNEDKFMLHLMNVVKQQLGPHSASYVEPLIHIAQGQTICEVNCQKKPEPVFLKNKKNPDGEFFTRTGPSTTKLGAEEMMKYINTHFKSQQYELHE
ncbi:MAG: ATP-binding protein [Pseudomonadota bacterium]